MSESRAERLQRLAAKRGWIGVDLDGTLAEYHGWKGPQHIGAPIAKMVARVKAWLEAGIEVRIFTARVDGGDVATAEGHPDAATMREVDAVKRVIAVWCWEHLGTQLPITNRKDYGMIELWDDRAVQVVENTGERADGAAECMIELWDDRAVQVVENTGERADGAAE